MQLFKLNYLFIYFFELLFCLTAVGRRNKVFATLLSQLLDKEQNFIHLNQQKRMCIEVYEPFEKSKHYI
jgi:hypothetical protein